MADEKTLEEHTVAELKEIARSTGKIEGISAMKKADLISAIQALQGEGAVSAEDVSPETAEPGPEKEAPKKTVKKTKTAPVKGPVTVSSLKEKMGELRERKLELKEKDDKVGVDRIRRRIKRLKKRTRGLAKSVS
ncbi:MAG TPA: Rho termination factor N-terminal domain-containing protein [Syntrophales bacterium]|nr:Rho termination factor N-terminal domain-containing protein [Syntrophales bacterium]HPQ45068.1 Rho termination factor N-terminal domain-containing protein [Syntrophales bacterium]